MEVTLKKWQMSDRDVLTAICNAIDRRYLSDHIPNPYTSADAEWWLAMVGENDGKTGVWRAIVVDGETIGTISVEQREDVYRIDGEIGYYLTTKMASKGIMTEAARQICALAFRELPLYRITGQIYEPNIPSRRVLEKTGFILEGQLKNAVIKDENIYDLCIYGKVKGA
ncbi:MAG: GNAT family protein [Aerococcus sp.]|nr:GNAT family protein [Aerococcus sp.]